MQYITPVTEADLNAVCALIEGQQRRPERTIPYLSDTAAAIAKEITAEDDWSQRAWLLRSEETVLGFLMADVDAELDRVWWMGPFATEDWAANADSLYAHGRSLIAMKGEEMASDERHLELAEFATRHGFRCDEAAVALRCTTPPGAPQTDGATVTEMTPTDRREVADLHDLVFPGTHTNGRQLVDRDTERFHCLIVREAGTLTGYVAVERQPDGSGYIDFVGVAPEYRRRGLGRVLVVAAANTLLERGSSYVHLTVRETNETARRLYASLGFTEDIIIRPYRKGFTIEGS